MKWIKQQNKGLFARELLQEFEKRYDQLSTSEQCSIRSQQVELFVQAADTRLQKSLEQLLEDASGELGLISDLKLTSDEEFKDKLATLKHKLKEPVPDDLVKGIHELNLNLKAVKLEGLSSKGSTSDSRPRLPRKDYNKIHLRATGEPIRVNFIQGGMKKLAEEILHNVTMVDSATYGLQDEEAAGSSKRATKFNNKKEKVPKPSPEVNMEDAPKDKKQGKPRGLFYKLKSDIELATDLKKVFEERILNSKVEMTLGDILGIAKCEFHDEIIDIIKRK
ncbi:hypothetical protein L7F22_018268 [Adiantum nelumboides]|nr:hypothetical protein [Adiantum nelumboides]